MVDGNELNLSEEEVKILEEFREKFRDELKPHHDDHFLLRWLKARRFNLENAEKMLREDFEFRERWKSDTILEEYQLKKGMEAYESSTFLGFCKQGYGVRFFNFGSYDFKGWCRSLSISDWIRYTIYYMELDYKHLKEHNLETGQQADSFIYVADMTDIKSQIFYDRAVAKACYEVVTMMQHHYPENAYALAFLNVPPLFHYAWNIVKQFIEPQVYKKITLYGNDGWHEQLFSMIPKEIFPAFVGGERYGPDNDPYCSDIIRWKKLPSCYYATESRLKKSDPGVRERVVRPFSSFELALDVGNPGSTLHWDFQTNKNDIRFGLIYKEQEENNAKQELLAPQLTECGTFPEKGSYFCKKSGKYVLLFDNSYSWFTSKKLLYKTEIHTPNDTAENELLVTRLG